MRRHDLLRASDADREGVIDRLREAAGEGRLEPDELAHRVDGALRARTYGDLAELVADLPGDGRGLWRDARRINPVVLGAGLVFAVIVALAVVALVVLLVLAMAAWWIALVLIWLVFRASRRRLDARPARRYSVAARHARHTRPTGFL
jgi:Flp pilus assembly protein TadB